MCDAASGVAQTIVFCRLRLSAGHENRWPAPQPARNPIPCFTMASTNSGYLVQTTFAAIGNFEMVVSSSRGGLVHVSRDNNSAGFPWMAPMFFASGFLEGASLIQRADKDQSPGDLEVVFRAGDRLAHVVRQESMWKEPVFFGSGISGRPAFIQSRFGAKGNYEVVVPRAAGGLAHYSRNNDDSAEPWSAPAVFAT